MLNVKHEIRSCITMLVFLEVDQIVFNETVQHHFVMLKVILLFKIMFLAWSFGHVSMATSCYGQYKAFAFLSFLKDKYAIDLFWCTLVDLVATGTEVCWGWSTLVSYFTDLPSKWWYIHLENEWHWVGKNFCSQNKVFIYPQLVFYSVFQRAVFW